MLRRRHGRIRTPGLACHLSPGDRFGNALSVENLSMGGAFINTPHPLREGSAVLLDFSKPGAPHALRLTGRVVSARKGGLAEFDTHAGMGICFDPLPADSEARLRSLLVSIAPGPMVLEGDQQGELPARPPPPNFRPLESVASLKPSTPTLRFERSRMGPANQMIGLVDELPVSPHEPPRLTPVPQSAPAAAPAVTRAPVAPAVTRAPVAPAAAPKITHAPAKPARAQLSAPKPAAIPAQRLSAPTSTASSPPMPPADPARLMVQIRGLLLEISDWQYKADTLEREKNELADEVERLKAELQRTRH